MRAPILLTQRITRSLALSGVVLWVIALWNPYYLSEPETAAHHPVPNWSARVDIHAGDVGPAIREGVQVTQDIFVSLSPAIEGISAPLRICVAIEFVTFERLNAGDVTIVLAVARMSESFSIPANQILNWDEVTFCLTDATTDAFDGQLTVTISGRYAANEHEAVGTLIQRVGRGVEGGLGGPATIILSDGSTYSVGGPLGLNATFETFGPTIVPSTEAQNAWPPVRAILLISPAIVGLLVSATLALGCGVRHG